MGEGCRTGKMNSSLRTSSSVRELFFGKPVPRAHRDELAHRRDDMHVEGRRDDASVCGEQERAIDVSGEQVLNKQLVVVLDDTEISRWGHLLVKLREQLRGGARLREVVEADAQAAAIAKRAASEGIEAVALCVERALSVGEECTAVLGQRDMARAALEQLRLKLFFERLHTARNNGLIDEQCICRLSETPAFGNGDKGLKALDEHANAPKQSIISKYNNELYPCSPASMRFLHTNAYMRNGHFVDGGV